MEVTACVFAGRRPARGGFGYDDGDERRQALKQVLAREVERLIGRGVALFYSGMDMGVEQWGAEIVLDMKRRYPHVRLAAVLPCETQADKWPLLQRERYFNILALVDDALTLRTRFTPGCVQERNRYMVDRAEYLLAVYDGAEKGGTAGTVRYALEKGRRLVVIHPDTFEVAPTVDFNAAHRRKPARISREGS